MATDAQTEIRRLQAEQLNEMIRLYGEPWCLSLAEIGKQLGLTKQAVAGRLARAGVERRPAGDVKRLRYEAWAATAPQFIDPMLADVTSVVELAAVTGAPRAWVTRYLRARHGRGTVKVTRAGNDRTTKPTKGARR